MATLGAFAAGGYLVAALLFLFLAVLLLLNRFVSQPSRLLLVAVLVSAGWALANAWHLYAQNLPAPALFIAELLRAASWLAFLASLVAMLRHDATASMLRIAALGLPVLVLAAGLLAPFLGDRPLSIIGTGVIAMSILALIMLESIYRSSRQETRRGLAFLALAISAIFGYDIVLYTVSSTLGEHSLSLWAARGAANALAVPFLIVAVRLNRDWRLDMFVSRQVAYFSVTVFGTGIYLMLAAVGGFYVRQYGGSLGGALQIIFVFGTLLFLAAILFSERLRRQVRVFFAKHFFRNRYDYRDEWRRLSATLYSPDNTQSVGERSVLAVAQIMGSRSGILLARDDGPHSPLVTVASWPQAAGDGLQVDAGDELIDYLESSQWIISTSQYLRDPAFYDGVALPDWLLSDQEQRFVVPLLQESELVGLIVLYHDNELRLTYEDTDLLKIVGRQIAGLLTQATDAERLAETRQLQAYSRLTAFIMHDLKNLAAQQSLVVKNAARHKRNPDFVDDAFQTIAHSVRRVNRLVNQLASRDRKEKRENLVVSKVLMSVVNQVSDREPVPELVGHEDLSVVIADPDKLSSMFTHVIRNAQDACEPDGCIEIRVESDNNEVHIAIQDDGIGMDSSFIRERLFKPFDSTKGVDGMGIGAYQVREYVRELSGRLRTESQSGAGTTITLCLPTASVT